jgi:23S rRNA (guanosine2251-2'-O)-methyltransferase
MRGPRPPGGRVAGRDVPIERRGPWTERRTDRFPRVDEAARLGPHEELVAGRRPVEEAFAARRPAIRLLVVPQRRQALERIVLHATTLRIPIVEVEGGTLTGLAGFDGHQGVALVVEPRRYATLDQVLARAIERGEPPFVLVLDSLEDPQNVGTLLRSAEAAGVHGVLFPTERQAPITPAAVKASAGATEHLLLCPVDDPPGALADLHIRGLRIIGSDADAPMTTREADLRGPVAIVVGSEGQGVGPAIRRRCDVFVRIPMRGAIGSLNAAVAGSVLLFEALGQRDPDARPSPTDRSARPPLEREEPMLPAIDDESTEPGTSEEAPAALSPDAADAPAPAGPAPEDDDSALLPGGPTPDPVADGAHPAAAADAGAAPSPVPESPRRRRRTPRA